MSQKRHREIQESNLYSSSSPLETKDKRKKTNAVGKADSTQRSKFQSERVKRTTSKIEDLLTSCPAVSTTLLEESLLLCLQACTLKCCTPSSATEEVWQE